MSDVDMSRNLAWKMGEWDRGKREAGLVEACDVALTWWHSIPGHFEEKEPKWLAQMREAIAEADERGN